MRAIIMEAAQRKAESMLMVWRFWPPVISGEKNGKLGKMPPDSV